MILALLGLVILATLIYDYVYPRWYYNLRAKRAKCGAIVKELSWPFGFANAYKVIKLSKEVKMLSHFSPPRSQKTILHQINTFFVIETADPENIKALLSTQFTDFNLSLRHAILSPLLGDGIFTVEGEVWRQQRAMLRPIFARERVSKLDMLETHFQSLLNKINSQTGYIDMQKYFFAFTLDTSMHFLFDLHHNSFSDRTSKIPTTDGPIPAQHLFDALGRTARFLGIRRLLGRFHRIVWTRQFKRDLKLIASFSDAIVDSVLSEEKENDCFISQAAKLNPDRVFLRDQAFTMFVAGRSTTASLLTHLVLDLSRLPEKWEKLRETVIREIGSAPEDITFEKLKRCSYVSACLNESLRLHPNVPINARAAVRDTVLPRGGGPNGSEPVFVPKGMNIQYNVYGLQRNPDIWGENASEFCPERWVGHKLVPWTYLPFNGGPRTCLGQQFALNEAGYILARLSQEFSRLNAGELIRENRYRFGLNLTIKVEPSVDVAFEP